ncbi:hypothetical protein ACWGH7_31090 [Streptomyces cyaneofuscatus]
MNKKQILAAAVAGCALSASALSGTSLAASTATVSAQAWSCVGTSFSATLHTGKSLCNGNYRLTMQTNGDLVLRVATTGRACYASGTRALDGASATFHKNLVSKPWVDITSPSQGRIGRVYGAHTPTTYGTNASVNSRGEFWIGYKKVGWC